jgi:formylglycine-generating enzyme required for sulfatase activity
MVQVPAGDFMMGCNTGDTDCDSDESPYHAVSLDAFYIGIYEVTAGEYKACVDAGDCTYSGSTTDSDRTYNNSRDDHPINYVNHTDAKTYCEAQGNRLPTAAEWEKAARGTDGRKYPWGNETPTCDLVVMDGCPDDTQPVGSLTAGASPYGAMDMAGNVLEWTADWYGSAYYGETPVAGWVNPQGPTSGGSRVLRGGSFTHSAQKLRTSYRNLQTPNATAPAFGFRCAQ